MLDKKVKKYLRENEVALLPEWQERYKKFLVDNGYNKDESFVEFMSQYSNEISGSEGHLFDVVGDLMDYTETSANCQMHTQYNVPTNYITLTDDTTECYLLYDRTACSVILIEGANFKKLLAKQFDRKWNTFNEFLIEFLEIDD